MQEEIRKQFPSLFEAGSEITAGKGWLRLAEGFCGSLIAFDPSAKVQSIKEKFGTLHFTYQAKLTINQEGTLIALENFLQKESESMCEICGEEGRKRIMTYRVMVRCDKCKEIV